MRPEEVSGPGGLLSQLAGRVFQAELEAEMTDHLGHPPGEVPQGPNVRNGVIPKTVQIELGLSRSRLRATGRGALSRSWSKRQPRLARLDKKILGLHAAWDDHP